MALATIKTFSLRGLTNPGGATINTVNVTMLANGLWQATLPSGAVVTFRPTGNVRAVLQGCFTGASGLDAPLHGAGRPLA